VPRTKDVSGGDNLQVTIDGRVLEQSISEMKQHSQKIAALVTEIESIRIITTSQTSSGQSIMSKWKQATADAKAHSTTLQKLHTALGEIQTEYLTCESRLCGQEYVKTTQENNSTTKTSWLSPDWSAAWSVTKDTIKGIGTVGATVNAIIGMSEGGESFAKGTAKLVGTGASMVQKLADGKTVDWFGKLANNGKSLSKELEKYVYDPTKCSTVTAKNASKIGVAAKWVGVGFTTMLNLKDNFEEFDYDFSNGRIYAETATETLIDVGAGVATNLLAYGILAATAGTVAAAAAPVWAVAVVGVGVTSVGNMIFEGIEAISGVDVKEWVSDRVVDAGEAIVDGVKTAGKAVGKAVSKAVDGVKEVGKTVGSAVSGTAKKISAGWKKLWGG